MAPFDLKEIIAERLRASERRRRTFEVKKSGKKVGEVFFAPTDGMHTARSTLVYETIETDIPFFPTHFLVKFRRQYPSKDKQVETEIAILEQLPEHPNIRRYLGNAIGLENRNLLLLEYLPQVVDPRGENNSLSPEDVPQFICDIARGLDFAHHWGVVHLDVKPNNTGRAPESGSFKLFDWGFSGTLPLAKRERRSKRFVGGTRGYMAPEVEKGIRKSPFKKKRYVVSPAADSYGLGRMLNELRYDPEKELYIFDDATRSTEVIDRSGLRPRYESGPHYRRVIVPDRYESMQVDDDKGPQGDLLLKLLPGLLKRNYKERMLPAEVVRVVHQHIGL